MPDSDWCYSRLSDSEKIRYHYWCEHLLSYDEKNAWIATKRAEYYSSFEKSATTSTDTDAHTCEYVDGLCTICEPF